MEGRDPKCSLNLRGFPVDLKWKCREKAAQEKETLAQFVERVLREAVKTRETERDKGKSRAKSKAR